MAVPHVPMQVKRHLHNSIAAPSPHYCDATDRPGGDYIHVMEDFSLVMGGTQPWEIARCVYHGPTFCPGHSYFRFDGDRLTSFDYAPGGSSGIDIDGIAAYVDRTGDALGSEQIKAILDDGT